MDHSDFSLDPRRVEIRIPTYRRHRASGHAVVTLAGKDVYLGTYGSGASKAEYKRHVAEYLASGGQAPGGDPAKSLTVAELILKYWRFATASYSGKTRKGMLKPILRRWRKAYGTTLVAEFGPLRLKAFRDMLVKEKDERGKRLSRGYVNRTIRMVRSVVKWGVSEELVAPSVLQSLQAVDGLRYGRTDAPETAPVRPVADQLVEATLPHLTPVVADMVRVQRHTGMRPAEVCGMTVGELDMKGPGWFYKPAKHKTAHHGKERLVPIGPLAQEIVKNYLSADLTKPLFTPGDSDLLRRLKARSENQTPFTPSRLARDAKRAKRPRRTFNPGYDSNNYAQAIRRACEKAEIPHWTPNQLRHTKATEIRRQFGLDAAGAVLGHSKLETTQVYAERATELAAQVAMKTG